MSDPIISPDGQFMWTGSDWIPVPPKSTQPNTKPKTGPPPRSTPKTGPPPKTKPKTGPPPRSTPKTGPPPKTKPKTGPPPRGESNDLDKGPGFFQSIIILIGTIIGAMITIINIANKMQGGMGYGSQSSSTATNSGYYVCIKCKSIQNVQGGYRGHRQCGCGGNMMWKT